MTTTKRVLEALVLMALLSGCPLTEDPQAKDDPDMSGDPAQGGDGTAADGADGTAGDGADGTSADGTPADGAPGDGSSGLDGGDDAGGDGTPDGGTPEGDGGPSEPDAGDPGPVVVVPDLGALDLPDQDRANLIRDLLVSENYLENWFPFFESTTELRDLAVAPSHGEKVRVFANGVANRAAQQWVAGGLALPARFPDGSVVLKEVYRTDAMTMQLALSQVVVMAKISGLDPVAYEGGWFYMKITTADGPVRSITCVNCHNGRKATAIWPVDPNIPGNMGGLEGGIVPYDYLFMPFCYDPRNPQCSAPE